MPRVAREKSKSGIYHVLLRGKDGQNIFHDDEDNARFLDILCRSKEKSGISVYGWCLMNNHAHLLIKEGEEALSNTMKRQTVSYVWYYKSKYHTRGCLFGDRFKSESSEQDLQLLTQIRFIHQNPVKAGLVTYPGKWKWSSCRQYYGFPGYPDQLLDEDIVLSMFDGNVDIARKLFIEFNEQDNSDWCLDEPRKTRLTDEEAVYAIKQVIDNYEINEIRNLPVAERNAFLRRIRVIDGLSLRHAARIIGVSHVLIHKA